MVMGVELDHRTSTWNVYPDGPVKYKFSENMVDILFILRKIHIV